MQESTNATPTIDEALPTPSPVTAKQSWALRFGPPLGVGMLGLAALLSLPGKTILGGWGLPLAGAIGTLLAAALMEVTGRWQHAGLRLVSSALLPIFGLVLCLGLASQMHQRQWVSESLPLGALLVAACCALGLWRYRLPVLTAVLALTVSSMLVNLIPVEDQRAVLFWEQENRLHAPVILGFLHLAVAFALGRWKPIAAAHLGALCIVGVTLVQAWLVGMLQTQTLTQWQALAVQAGLLVPLLGMRRFGSAVFVLASSGTLAVLYQMSLQPRSIHAGEVLGALGLAAIAWLLVDLALKRWLPHRSTVTGRPAPASPSSASAVQ